MLVLPIKKKWFDMIKSGEKKEEYREIKPYYDTRIGKLLVLQTLISKLDGVGFVTNIQLRNGYGKDKPTLLCECEVSKGYGKEEWGAEPNKLYYVLKILNVEEIC